MSIITTISELEKLRERILAERGQEKRYIAVCGGTGCHSLDHEKLAEIFAESLQKNGIIDTSIRKTGCLGFCEQGPVVIIYPEGIFYCRVTAEDVPENLSSRDYKQE